MASHKLQHIVVIGGGAGGAGVVQELVPKLNPAKHRLVLITSRPYFIDYPAMGRTVVTSEGALEELVFMPYGDAFVARKCYPGTTQIFAAVVKVGKVVSFTSEEQGKGGGNVLLEGGEAIRYDILVLATGSTWSGPLDIPETNFGEAKEHLDVWRGRFSASQNIVLIGGGAVGLELAGEITDFHPTSKVTIVHRDSDLFNPGYPTRFRKAALRRIQRAGVEVLLGDSLEQTEPASQGTVTTLGGRVLQADLVIPCWGGRPNTSLVASSLGVHVLSGRGHVKVKPTLQIEGYPRIFAVGDIIDWDEQKQAVKARQGHAPVVVANVLSLVNGRETRKVYKGFFELMALVVGRGGGLLYFELFWGISIILGDFVMRFLKSKSLVIEYIRKQYGFGSFRQKD